MIKSHRSHEKVSKFSENWYQERETRNDSLLCETSKRPTSPKQGPCDRAKSLRNPLPQNFRELPPHLMPWNPKTQSRWSDPSQGLGKQLTNMAVPGHGEARQTDPQTLYCVFSYALGYWAEPQGPQMSVSQTSKGLLQPFWGWMDSRLSFSTTDFLLWVPKLRKGFLLCPAEPSPFLTQTLHFLLEQSNTHSNRN